MTKPIDFEEYSLHCPKYSQGTCAVKSKSSYFPTPNYYHICKEDVCEAFYWANIVCKNLSSSNNINDEEDF